MAQPKWITPTGNFGTVPELEYYEFMFDAYDPTGGGLTFSLVSGRLPPGLQIISTGKLQGIPVSELVGEATVSYRFTIRAKNLDKQVADRTFSISITNVAPPIIAPKNVDLGTYFDGTLINVQLHAIEYTPNATLVWSVIGGTLPLGLTLLPNGTLKGYLQGAVAPGPGSTPGWDDTFWDIKPTIKNEALGWDFTTDLISKSYSFTIQVYDGTFTDQSTYQLLILPRQDMLVSNTFSADPAGDTVKADTVNIRSVFDFTNLNVTSQELTVSETNKHVPIILTTQGDLVKVRQNSYFAFQFMALDFDQDILSFIIPSKHGSYYDELDIGFDTTDFSQDQMSIPGGELILETTCIATTSFIDANGTSFPAIIVNNIDGIYPGIQLSIDKQVGKVMYISSALLNQGFTVETGADVTVRKYQVLDPIEFAADYILFTDGVTDTYIPVPGALLDTDYVYANAYINNVPTLITVIPGITEALDQFFVPAGALVVITIYRVVSNVTNFTVSTANNIDTYIPTLGSFAGTDQLLVSAMRHSVIEKTPTFGYLPGSQYIFDGFTIDANSVITLVLTDWVGSIINITTIDQLSYYYTIERGATIDTYTSKPNVWNNTYYLQIYATCFGSVPVNALFIVAASNTVDTSKITNSANAIFTANSQLVLDENTGWFTGRLPTQSMSKVSYDFEVLVYKRDYPEYKTRQLFQLVVLGDLSDTINWITLPDLGTINNGAISKLSVLAQSTTGRQLYYSLGSTKRLPQGLQLNPQGLIFGRVSFEVFSLYDIVNSVKTPTTMDNGNTRFDSQYAFTVVAQDYDRTVSIEQTFFISVYARNTAPYEDLYLKASPTRTQREAFGEIVSDASIFDPALIYRNTDPFFGVASDIKFLFLAGLEASTLPEYIAAVGANHSNKRVTFGEIKTAISLDANFNIDYEVVYLEVIDPASNMMGGSASSPIDLSRSIKTPYYEYNRTTTPVTNREYTTAYPNGFNNMRDAVTSTIPYSNKGALPSWMTSNQISPSGAILPPLGLTHGVVLAYTVPNSSAKIAYKLKLRIDPSIQTSNTNGGMAGMPSQSATPYNFNEIDFTVDRYQLDNTYSQNYNPVTNLYVTSTETSFDRLVATHSLYVNQGVVDYAVSIPFNDIDRKSVTEIRDNGGLDGIVDFNDGDYLIFAEQEYYTVPNMLVPTNYNIDYNYGWNRTTVIWDSDGWAHNANTSDADMGDPTLDLTPGEAWDKSTFIPGYHEYINKATVGPLDIAFVLFPLAPVHDQLATVNTLLYQFDSATQHWKVANQRAGIWQISIQADNIVVLNFISAISFFDTLHIRNGNTYSGNTLFFDPILQNNRHLPAYSVLPRTHTLAKTTFDGNGTRFLSNRDLAVTPNSDDKYIKFIKLGVFT